METNAEEATKAVTSAEQKLQNALDQKEPDHAAFEPLLEKLRLRSGNLALLTLTTDQSADTVETRLWDFHVKVNSKFKPYLRSFRDGSGRKKFVERRKAHKIYTDFIKASQRFYRAYVERLTANFTNVSKVEDIARKLVKESPTVQAQKVATEEQRAILEKSCKKCLIRLGDLSRWRETELRPNEWNWGPAKGYYQLALTLDPAEGICHNQLAAIYLHSEDHLAAVYHLYRATATAKPSPTAPGNLKIEFEKVLKIRNEESYGMTDKSDDTLVGSLEKRFLAFHANCFARPYDFVSFQQRAQDILHMITLCFEIEAKTGGFGRFMYRATLINMAAEALAQAGMNKEPPTKDDPIEKQGTSEGQTTSDKAPNNEKQSANDKQLSSETNEKQLIDKKFAQEKDRNSQAFFLYQRFNLLFFQCLLKILARELGEPTPEGKDLSDISRLSPVVAKILPHLRQYSSWFLSHMPDLIGTKYKSSRKVLEQVSGTYAQTLNLLSKSVDIFTSSQIAHLLLEDEETLSFSSFTPKVFQWRHCDPQGNVKPTRAILDESKEMGDKLYYAETHLRATDLIIDALRLVKHQDDLNLKAVPISLENQKFIAIEIPELALPVAAVPPSPPPKFWRRSKIHARGPSTGEAMDGVSLPVTDSSVSVKPAITSTPEVIMTDAVDNITETKIDTAPPKQNTEGWNDSQPMPEDLSVNLNSSSIITGTPAQATGSMTAMDLVRQMQRSSVGVTASQRSPESGKRFAHPAHLVSMFNSPFTPTLSESAQLSPRIDVGQKRSPSFHDANISSSVIFQEQIARQQHEIQQRSSPQPPFQPPSSWDTFGQTPTGMDSMLRAYENNNARTPSPYATNHGQVNGRSPKPRHTSNPAPFGVIGQSRPLSRNGPWNGHG